MISHVVFCSFVRAVLRVPLLIESNDFVRGIGSYNFNHVFYTTVVRCTILYLMKFLLFMYYFMDIDF